MSLLTELFLSRIRVARDIHRHAFRCYGTRTALLFPERATSYRELQERSYRLAQAWRALGLKKGDIVFAQVDADPAFFELRIAALEAGIVLASFHHRHAPDLLAHAARAAPPALYVVDPGYAPGCAEAVRTAAPGTVIWQDPGRPGGDYETSLATRAPLQSSETVHPRDPMSLGFTSGTTGPPKGLLSSNGAAVASLKLIIRNLNIRPDRKARNVSLSAIPLTGAGSGLILPTMLSGGTLVVMREHSTAAILESISRHRVTRLFLTPSQLVDLLDLPPGERAATDSLEHIIYGTAPMPAARLREAIATFGPILQQGYGQAEVLPPVSLLRPQDHMRGDRPAPRRVLRSCGRVVKGVELRIAGARRVPGCHDAVGAIHVRTPTRFSGYLEPARNGGVILDDGYFVTGDHGFIDDEGYLHVLGREAEIIDSPAGPIHPRLVEEEAHEHPAVKECCLVEHAGKRVLCLALRSRHRQGRKDEIAAEVGVTLRAALPEALRPDRIVIFPALPRSFLCKIAPRDIRRKLADEHAA